MKKLFAILICLSLMLSALPVFGETVSNEEAFKSGLMALMNSFDLQRDQLTYTATSGDEVIAAETVRFDGSLLELSVAAAQLPGGVTVQFNDQEIYAALSGTAFHLRFEEIPVILQSLAATLSQYVPQEYFEAIQKIDPDKLAEMGQMFLQRLMMSMKMEQTEDGMVISYEATAQELLQTVAVFVDDVLANEEYADTVKGLVTVGLYAAQNSNPGSEMPSADDLIASWPMLKQSLASVESDFAVALRLFASTDGTVYQLEGSIGVPADTYLMKWDLKADMENGVFVLDGKLTERIQISAESEARDYDIDIHADLTQTGSMTNYNFTIDYPTATLHLKNPVKVGNTVNKLQLSLDVKNVLNFFNNSWGVSKYLNPELGSDPRILKYEGVDAEGYATYSTPAAVSGSLKTFVPNHSLGQCWYASVGIKYMFN